MSEPLEWFSMGDGVIRPLTEEEVERYPRLPMSGHPDYRNGGQGSEGSR